MRILFSFLSLQLLSFQLTGQHTDRSLQISDLMETAGIPGLAVAYIKNGEIHEMYHLGMRSADTKEPVNNETVFAAASLSKPVFAYGVMKLVDAGKLDLDKPLHKTYCR